MMTSRAFSLMWMPIKETSLNFNTFDIVMNVKVLKRLRRKARHAIKDRKVTGTLNLVYKTYDGTLHVIGPSSAQIDMSRTVESFRRLWIMNKVKYLRGLKAFSGK